MKQLLYTLSLFIYLFPIRSSAQSFNQDYFDVINMNQAWGITTGNTGQRIAYIGLGSPNIFSLALNNKARFYAEIGDDGYVIRDYPNTQNSTAFASISSMNPLVYKPVNYHTIVDVYNIAKVATT